MTTKTTPEKIPVDGKPSRKRGGADPVDAIQSPEVRAHAYIERAFELVEDPEARRRLAWLVQDKYGPRLIPGIRLTGIGVAGNARDAAAPAGE